MDAQRTTDSLKGYFLIATPVIESGFFKGTVTYVCEHGEAGAMGIVINKPLDLQLAEFLLNLQQEPTYDLLRSCELEVINTFGHDGSTLLGASTVWQMEKT